MTWLTETDRDPRPAGDRLAALWAEPGIVGLPGAHDPLAALLARRAGFRALYVSGAGRLGEPGPARSRRPDARRAHPRHPRDRARVGAARPRRRRHGLRRGAQRDAPRAGAGGRGRGGRPARGPGDAQEVRAPLRQAPGRAGGDGAEGRRGRAGGASPPDRRPDRRRGAGGPRQGDRASAALPGGRRARDLPRGAPDRRRAPGLRRRGPGTAPRQHDGLRPDAAPPRRRARAPRLQAGDLAGLGAPRGRRRDGRLLRGPGPDRHPGRRGSTGCRPAGSSTS